MRGPEPSAAVLDLLGFVVLTKTGGVYSALQPAPDWLHRLCPGASGEMGTDALIASLPFLETFLPDAAECWAGAGGPLRRSGPWVQRDLLDIECALEAFAVRRDSQQFLVIRLLGDEYRELRAAWQRTRDSALERERLERRVEDLAAASLELESANLQAQRVNRLKSEFLAGMSHELRTPLNAIVGFAGLLKRSGGTLAAKQQDWVAHISQAADHLLDLINDVLDLSKIEAGSVSLDLERFWLGEALGEVLPALQPLAASKAVAIEWAGAADIQVCADRTRVKQILYNLLSNAIKFNVNGGRVEVRAEECESEIRLAVADTGIGIPVSERAAIFDEYRQVKSRLAGSRGGTGLGLAITKRLVEQHGGRIWVEDAENRGSRFCFTLPMCGETRAGAEPEPAGPGERDRLRAWHRRRALDIAVADESAASRDLLGAMLGEWHRVRAYRSAPDAVAGMREKRPDVLLLDFGLPLAASLAVLDSIRKDEALAGLPVIAITAHAMRGDRERLLAAGCDGYVAKPVADAAVILQAIANVVSRGWNGLPANR